MNTNTHIRTRIIRIGLVLAAGLAILAWAGCAKRTTASQDMKDAADKVGSAFSKTWDNLKNATASDRAALASTLGKTTDSLSAKSSEWTSKLSTLKDDVRPKAQAALDDLNSAISDMKGKLSGVGGATDKTWDEIKNGLIASYKKAQESYAKLQGYFASDSTPAQPK